MLNIPDSMKNMIDDYQEAADKGRSLKDQECKDVFDSCDFSVKETFLKKFQKLQDWFSILITINYLIKNWETLLYLIFPFSSLNHPLNYSIFGSGTQIFSLI